MKKIYNVLMALRWYHPKIHMGIAKYAGLHNWHLNTTMAFTNEPVYGWQGDGILTQNWTSEFDSFLNSLEAPLVRINEVISDDNLAIGRLAADYFHNLRYRHYAACPLGGVYSLPSRTQYYINRVAELGFECEVFPINGCTNWLERRNILSKCLKDATYPLAVFAADDNQAAEIIETCLTEGIEVPEQVAVLGVRNDPLICESLAVSLSSIENHLEMQGYKAAEVLDYIMRGETTENLSLEIESPYVVTRESSDVIAIQHPEVAQALKFIKDNFQDNIGIDDIVDATAMSKRGLHYAFQQYLGRSIGKELTRVRLDNAVELMDTTDDKLLLIAGRSGFNNIVSFHQAFKQRFNMSPGAYRKMLKQTVKPTEL